MTKDRRKISFVNRENLKVIKSREDFIRIKDNSGKHLVGYDLSNIDVSNINLSDFRLEDVVFNYFDVEKKDRKEIFNVNFTGCVMERVSFAQSTLRRCNFDSYEVLHEDENKDIIKAKHTTTLNECDFFFSELENCRFKHTQVNIADFRYSSLIDCSMGCCQVKYGDFYMAAFHGATNFAHSKFELCSITNATFENHCLLMDNINRLVQEDYKNYSEVLINKKNWSKHNPCASFSVRNEAKTKYGELKSRILIAHETVQAYTILSGIYSGKGFFRDSNRAYAKAKNSELRYYGLLLRKDLNNRQIWGCLKDVIEICGLGFARLLGYGFKVWPVLGCLAFVILCGWLFFFQYANVKNHTWDTSLAYSICNSLGPYFDKIDEIHHFIASFEPALGILLMGFLGFVMANKIRNNS